MTSHSTDWVRLMTVSAAIGRINRHDGPTDRLENCLSASSVIFAPERPRLLQSSPIKSRSNRSEAATGQMFPMQKKRHHLDPSRRYPASADVGSPSDLSAHTGSRPVSAISQPTLGLRAVGRVSPFRELWNGIVDAYALAACGLYPTEHSISFVQSMTSVTTDEGEKISGKHQDRVRGSNEMPVTGSHRSDAALARKSSSEICNYGTGPVLSAGDVE
jgi:hypothetical protein